LLFRSLLLSKRPLDADFDNGFHKWPFMTTHAWGEKANGLWKIEILFDSQNYETTGDFFEWILLLHGTNEAPYKEQTPLNDKTKLAVSKSIHQNDFKEKERFVDVLTQDNQKRVGNSLEFERESKN
jgi:proprotein convertase subtilisin/kexin type 2